MNRLVGTLTGRQRRADRAQAARITRAWRESDKAHRARSLNGTRDSDAATARAGAVLLRAMANASPRAAGTASRIRQDTCASWPGYVKKLERDEARQDRARRPGRIRGRAR